MDDIIFEEAKALYDKPLIQKSNFKESDHLILSKYTSPSYYKYSIDLLETLCKQSNYENKRYIFHMSLHYLLIILYNCCNTPCINNYDILILCCFSLGIKVSTNQHQPPFISKIKQIYPEKYSFYKNEEIQKAEIICIKLLNYDINILTSYDCLFEECIYDKKLFNNSINELEKIIRQDVKKLLYISPLELAKESKQNAKHKNNYKNLPSIIISKKIIPSPLPVKKFSKNRVRKLVVVNNESPSTGSSSFASGKNVNKNENQKGLRSKSIITYTKKNTCKNIAFKFKTGQTRKYFFLGSKNESNKESNTESCSKYFVNNLINESATSTHYKAFSIDFNTFGPFINQLNKNKILQETEQPQKKKYSFNLAKNFSGTNIFKKPNVEQINMKANFTNKKNNMKIEFNNDKKSKFKNNNIRNLKDKSKICLKIDFDGYLKNDEDDY